MMFEPFIVVAVFLVVKGDTLVENFYVKLKDLRNQYNSEIGELKQLNNEQRILITNLTDVIDQTSLRSVVNEQRQVLKTTNQTVDDLRETMEEVRSEQRQVLETRNQIMEDLRETVRK